MPPPFSPAADAGVRLHKLHTFRVKVPSDSLIQHSRRFTATECRKPAFQNCGIRSGLKRRSCYLQHRIETYRNSRTLRHDNAHACPTLSGKHPKNIPSRPPHAKPYDAANGTGIAKKQPNPAPYTFNPSGTGAEANARFPRRLPAAVGNTRRPQNGAYCVFPKTQSDAIFRKGASRQPRNTPQFSPQLLQLGCRIRAFPYTRSEGPNGIPPALLPILKHSTGTARKNRRNPHLHKYPQRAYENLHRNAAGRDDRTKGPPAL